MVLAFVSWFSIFQQNCKQSFMIPSNILDTEPISKNDCDIKADKYLQASFKQDNKFPNELKLYFTTIY